MLVEADRLEFDGALHDGRLGRREVVSLLQHRRRGARFAALRPHPLVGRRVGGGGNLVAYIPVSEFIKSNMEGPLLVTYPKLGRRDERFEVVVVAGLDVGAVLLVLLLEPPDDMMSLRLLPTMTTGQIMKNHAPFGSAGPLGSDLLGLAAGRFLDGAQRRRCRAHEGSRG